VRHRFSLRTFFAVVTVVCVALFFVSRWLVPRDRGSYSEGVRIVQFDQSPETLYGQGRDVAERSLQIERYTFGKSRFRGSVYDGGSATKYELPNPFGKYEYVFGSANWWDDPAGYLTDSHGNGIDVIVRVVGTGPGEKGGKRFNSVRVEFLAHMDNCDYRIHKCCPGEVRTGRSGHAQEV
jgi:hypothetical protein